MSSSCSLKHRVNNRVTLSGSMSPGSSSEPTIEAAIKHGDASVKVSARAVDVEWRPSNVLTIKASTSYQKQFTMALADKRASFNVSYRDRERHVALSGDLSSVSLEAVTTYEPERVITSVMEFMGLVGAHDYQAQRAQMRFLRLLHSSLEGADTTSPTSINASTTASRVRERWWKHQAALLQQRPSETATGVLPPRALQGAIGFKAKRNVDVANWSINSSAEDLLDLTVGTSLSGDGWSACGTWYERSNRRAHKYVHVTLTAAVVWSWWQACKLESNDVDWLVQRRAGSGVVRASHRVAGQGAEARAGCEVEDCQRPHQVLDDAVLAPGSRNELLVQQAHVAQGRMHSISHGSRRRCWIVAAGIRLVVSLVIARAGVSINAGVRWKHKLDLREGRLENRPNEGIIRIFAARRIIHCVCVWASVLSLSSSSPLVSLAHAPSHTPELLASLSRYLPFHPTCSNPNGLVTGVLARGCCAS